MNVSIRSKLLTFLHYSRLPMVNACISGARCRGITDEGKRTDEPMFNTTRVYCTVISCIIPKVERAREMDTCYVNSVGRTRQRVGRGGAARSGGSLVVSSPIKSQVDSSTVSTGCLAEPQKWIASTRRYVLNELHFFSAALRAMLSINTRTFTLLPISLGNKIKIFK